MSAVMQDLLRHLNVEQHPCLQRPFETRCGLSVNHPATLGVSLYEFNDTETRLTGHAVQTEVAGICLDHACIKITPVAIHRPSFESMPSSSSRHGGVAACSYQLIPGGSLASIVGAMATVEEVRNLSALAAERGTVVTEYGVVVRHADRTWRADVFRDVRSYTRVVSIALVYLCEWAALDGAPVRTSDAVVLIVCSALKYFSSLRRFTLLLRLQAILPIPAENTPLFCNLTELKVAGLDSYAEGLSAKGDPTSAPRRLPTLKTDTPGCTFSNGSPYSGGPDGGVVAPPPGSGTFPAAPSFLHVADADVNGTVSLHCSRYGDLLRVAASSAASTQDAVATGHQGANFLSRVPPLAAPIEITLLVVTAVQGLFTAFVLLFDRPDERLRRFEATYRQWRDWAPLPLNDNVIVPRRERNVPRAVLLLLVIIIAMYVSTLTFRLTWARLMGAAWMNVAMVRLTRLFLDLGSWWGWLLVGLCVANCYLYGRPVLSSYPWWWWSFKRLRRKSGRACLLTLTSW